MSPCDHRAFHHLHRLWENCHHWPRFAEILAVTKHYNQPGPNQVNPGRVITRIFRTNQYLQRAARSFYCMDTYIYFTEGLA